MIFDIVLLAAVLLLTYELKQNNIVIDKILTGMSIDSDINDLMDKRLQNLEYKSKLPKNPNPSPMPDVSKPLDDKAQPLITYTGHT